MKPAREDKLYQGFQNRRLHKICPNGLSVYKYIFFKTQPTQPDSLVTHKWSVDSHTRAPGFEGSIKTSDTFRANNFAHRAGDTEV